MTTTKQPRVYIACLAAYNNGHLHGDWFDCDFELNDNIQKVLKTSPIPNAEEWAIHDHEGFGSYSISEYHGIDELVEIADLIAEHGEILPELIAWRGDIKGALEALEHYYEGKFESELDFAYYHVEQSVNIDDLPELIRHAIDYDSIATTIFINDFHSIKLNHKFHVFSNHCE